MLQIGVYSSLSGPLPQLIKLLQNISASKLHVFVQDQIINHSCRMNAVIELS